MDAARGRPTMRALVTAGVAAALVLGGTLAVIAANRDATPKVTGPSDGTIRATRYYPVGPRAEYGADHGNIGVVDPANVSLPAGTYDVVLTLSFDLRTSPNDTFIVGVRSEETQILPREHLVAPTGPGSTTVMFRIRALAGGDTYGFEPFVNTEDRIGHAKIVTERMLLVVDATPTT